MSSLPRYRPMDGYNVNPDHPTWGTLRQPLEYISTPEAYADNVSSTAGPHRNSARYISDVLFTSQFKFNVISGASGWFPYYGQFLAHDMILQASSNVTFHIPVPRCDMGYGFDPNCTGTATIPFTREGGSVTSRGYFQGQNLATSWLDLNLVYGLGDNRTSYLRTFSDGKMKTSQGPRGELLPFNLPLFDNAGPMTPNMFLAGDPRCNINLPLLALHTLFVLEHNKWATTFKQRNPTWDDETLFQEARRFTIAIHQKIAYYEYLPKLLAHGLEPYTAFNPNLSPAIDVAFMTAAFRYGHSSTNQQVYRMQESRVPVADGPLNVADTILNPQEYRVNGMDDVLRGLILEPEADADDNMVEGMRTHPILGDMAAVDIQRGRDRGVPDYNTVRQALGMPRARNWSDVTSNPEYQRRLAIAYNSVDDLDLYVGGLSEDKVGTGIIGPTFNALVTAQFLRTRDADPYFFMRPGLFSTDELNKIQNRSLSSMILDFTQVKWMPSDVFALEQIPTASSASSTSVATGFTGIFSPLPGYTVSWAITSDCVWTVQIVSTRGGWAGIGFGTQMAGSDVILCYMNGGAMTCVDSMVVGQFETAPTSDDEIGHTNDVLPGTVTGQILGGVLTAQFSRRCSTGDSIDHVITRAMTPMIFAHGPTPRPAQHGLFGRALGTVNLFTNQAALSNEDVFHLSTTSAAAFSSIGFIFLALQALTLLAIVGFRKTRAVFFQGPSLLITMLLGSMMISGTLILTTVEQSASICAWRLFLSSMGFSLIFATLLGKLYRYNKIFYNKSALTVKVTNVHIVSGTLIFLAVDAILCGIWIGVSPMKIASEAPNTCSDSLTATGISTVLLIVKGVILVGSVWLYRNLQALEGRTASMFKSDINMTGQISALSLLFLAILLLVNEVSTSTVFQRTILLIQCIAALFVSVVPYVWYACVKVVFLLDDRKARKSSHVSEAIASTNMAAKGYTSTKKTKGDTKVAGGTSVQLGDSTSESATAGDAADTKGLQSDVSKNFRIKLDEVQKALTEYNMYDQLAQKSSAKFNKLKSELLQMEAEMDFRNQ